MAGQLAQPGSRGGGRMRHRRPPMSEINVTPMVDVMLVLLIIFMITAPLLTVGVPVDLPKTEAAVITGQDEPLVISINRGGRIYLQETELKLDVLGARLRAITRNKLDTRIFVRGDRAVVYGRIMEVMGTINVAGFRHVALIAELPTDRPGR
ncbi:MAG: protein TolR [Alphaproteobacteria bacterium]|nr:protein TolR [Alphaproteobacteria bacterium]MCZ6495593.1 protein TolR [Alphaproteobacteria bacterium]MCZ6609618.1 protein TolR [Alphaproteobacteria bacterium]MCZ6740625.1 protein TolR [Alphaproteobacteria bacterium]